jgi:5-methylcytosine-specific restriction protein A
MFNCCLNTGIKMWFIAKKFIRGAYRSPKWSEVRSQHLSIQPKCAICGSSTKPEVHHIVPVHIDSSRELDPNNLITLCDKYCHFIFGHLMNWKSWNEQIIQDSIYFSSKIRLKPK